MSGYNPNYQPNQPRRQTFWDQLDQQMFQRLFGAQKLNPKRRQFLETIHGKQPSNKMKCILHQIYCETFNRPPKDVVIQAWVPREQFQAQQGGYRQPQPGNYQPQPQTRGYGQPPEQYPPTGQTYRGEYNQYPHPQQEWNPPPQQTQTAPQQGEFPVPQEQAGPQPADADTFDFTDDEDTQ